MPYPFEEIQADFWDCNEHTEYLTHEAVDCAVEDYLHSRIRHGGDLSVEAQLRALAPLEVWPWRRHEIGLTQVEGATDELLEKAADYLDDDEEIGDPGGYHECLPEEVRSKYRDRMRSLVADMYAEAEPWGCAPGDPVELSPDQVVELMRQHCPEWFEKDDEQDPTGS